MSVYKQLDKEIAQLSDMISVLRSQAFVLAQSSMQGLEQLAETQLNDVSDQLALVTKQLKSIKRWASEIKDNTTV